MNFYVEIKKILLVVVFTVFLFTGVTKTFASDYQYKILDPKYNPAAVNLVNGTVPLVEEVSVSGEKNGFNLLRFLAIFAAISFPIFVIYLATKAFKEVMEGVPGSGVQVLENSSIGNIKIGDNASEIEKLYEKNNQLKQVINKSLVEKDNDITNIDNIVTSDSVSDIIKKDVTALVGGVNIEKDRICTEKNINLKPSVVISPQNKDSVATIPVKAKNPMLLNTAPLTKNKGLCLVEYENKYSLIGYVGKKVFFLNQFDSLKSSEIRPRFTERNDGKDRYLVRLDSYKGLIEVSDSDMNLLINL